MPHRTRRRVFLGAAAAFVFAALAILAISAVRGLASATSALDDARTLIQSDVASKNTLFTAAGRQQLAINLQAVDRDVAVANAALRGSFGLKIIGHLPYLGDQRRGVIQLVADAGMISTTTERLLHQADALIAQSNGTSVSLPALAAFQGEVQAAAVAVRELDRPTGNLFGPLGRARHSFDSEMRQVAGDLARGNRALSYLAPFLGAFGPRTYLVAGENNAEMRDQGDVLSLALLHTSGGTFSVDQLGSVDAIEPTRPVSVAIPPSTVAAFGGESPASLWQSVNATADFPLSSRLMQAMLAETRGTHVNGVIGLDVPALSSLLEISGPVLVTGINQFITAKNVATVLLYEQYLQYGAASQQAHRHDNISAVAQAVVQRMKSEHVDLGALSGALARDVAGRHILVWDAVPSYESTVTALGASGAIDASAAARTFHLAVQNSTATKLDFFVNSEASYKVQVTPGGDALITTTVTVSNTTPANLGPTYQTGPDGIHSFTPGQYVGRIDLWSPQGAVAPGARTESGLQLRQVQVSVLPQERATESFGTVIHHAVKNGRFLLRFIPQPRLAPETLSVSLSAPGWSVTGPARVHVFLFGTTALSWGLTRR